MWSEILTIFITSMTPLSELRGAVIYAAAAGVPWWVTAPVAILGNMVPVPFILLFIRQIFKWMRKVSKTFARIVDKMEAKANQHREKVTKYGFWGLFILVAIPLPGTGAWTGALVAAMMELRMKTAVPAIFVGVIGAAVIMCVACFGGSELLSFLLK